MLDVSVVPVCVRVCYIRDRVREGLYAVGVDDGRGSQCHVASKFPYLDVVFIQDPKTGKYYDNMGCEIVSY